MGISFWWRDGRLKVPTWYPGMAGSSDQVPAAAPAKSRPDREAPDDVFGQPALDPGILVQDLNPIKKKPSIYSISQPPRMLIVSPL